LMPRTPCSGSIRPRIIYRGGIFDWSGP
jgi:hypothetical protein